MTSDHIFCLHHIGFTLLDPWWLLWVILQCFTSFSLSFLIVSLYDDSLSFRGSKKAIHPITQFMVWESNRERDGIECTIGEAGVPSSWSWSCETLSGEPAFLFPPLLSVYHFSLSGFHVPQRPWRSGVTLAPRPFSLSIGYEQIRDNLDHTGLVHLCFLRVCNGDAGSLIFLWEVRLFTMHLARIFQQPRWTTLKHSIQVMSI